MTFNAIIEARHLEPFVEHLSTLVDEASIQLDEDEIRAVAVDPANVAFVDTRLGEGAFESYEADGETIGINIERVEEVLKFAGKGDLVHLDLDEETRRLQLTVDGMEVTRGLIDPDTIRSSQAPEDIDVDLTANISLEGRNLKRAVKAAEMVSDHLAFGATAEGLFYAEADGDTDEMRLEVNGEEIIDGSIDEDAEALFSIDYLKSVTKPIAKDRVTRVELGTEFPMKMRFAYADGVGATEYMVAPRIQRE